MQSILAVDDFYSRKLGLENKAESEINKLSKRNIFIIRDNDTLNVDLEKFKVNGHLELTHTLIRMTSLMFRMKVNISM